MNDSRPEIDLEKTKVHFVDLHCHPTIKPFGWACPGNTNNIDASLKNSIWHDDPPTTWDMRLNKCPGLTRFSQSNFTALHQGKFRVVIAALNPIEKGFFTSSLGSGNLADHIYNFITMIGKKKVDFIQRYKDYFLELCTEYKFFKQLHDTQVTIYGEDTCYRLTSNFKDIDDNLKIPNVISVVLSIEGGHSFNIDNRYPPDRSVLLKINEVKQWEHPPFFVTLCHHFYNYFGGHARSLPFSLRLLVNQSYKINTGIEDLGKDVIRSLLSTDYGRRIYIDIKHMSRKLRIDYYQFLKDEYGPVEFPIIVSHGAMNGYKSIEDLTNHTRKRNCHFKKRDINFFDDEILKIEKSGGIFGLQIDDRLITNMYQKIKIIFFCWSRKKKSKMRARLVWNHIKYIAELLDENGFYAWGIMAIGSDFDGMVNPIDGYWTSAELPDLYANLSELADEYLRPKPFTQQRNNISAQKVVDAIFSGNAMNFLSRYY